MITPRGLVERFYYEVCPTSVLGSTEVAPLFLALYH